SDIRMSAKSIPLYTMYVQGLRCRTSFPGTAATEIEEPPWWGPLQPPRRPADHALDAFAHVLRLGGEVLARVDEAVELEAGLLLVEAAVEAALAEEFLVRAALDDAALVHDEDLVGGL